VGQIEGGVVLLQDVTAERMSATKLAESRAFTDAVLVASPDITTVTDLQTSEVTWSSRPVADMLGWTPEQIPNLHGSDSQPPIAVEDQARVRAADAAVRQLADGNSVTVRYRLCHNQGCNWVSRRTTPFGRDVNGAVITGLSVVGEVSDLVAAEERLQHAALHDSLTGLPNRALLVDRIGSAIARAEREGTEVGVLFCDLDGFKRINDTDGHAAGDAVLIAVAERLQQVLRKGDSIARVGGDEFVIVLESGRPGRPRRPDAESVAARAVNQGDPGVVDAKAVGLLVMNRMQVSLAEPITYRNRDYVVSVSVGMTFARGGSVAEDVLRDADAAMYLAKQRGKNRFEVFDDTLRSDVIERIEGVLRSALTADDPSSAELSVAYHPVFDLALGRLVGFEALARLTDGEGVSIPPDSFIPVAEDTGLITNLGERVLNVSLDELVRWRAGQVTGSPATMAVNLSARQVQRADMPSLVRSLLRAHGLHPGDLTLELTESVLLEAGSSTLRQLTELRESGVRIAIDDFGTGYASLRYLATLPVTDVKVDQSFTAGLPHDATSAKIVRSVAALAADLKLGCVVEGIETEAQLAALPVGVLGQGYLLGRPAALPQGRWIASPRAAPSPRDGGRPRAKRVRQPVAKP
jgi:predicted signal transduction protein with EAL and GGDEF domain